MSLNPRWFTVLGRKANDQDGQDTSLKETLEILHTSSGRYINMFATRFK